MYDIFEDEILMSSLDKLLEARHVCLSVDLVLLWPVCVVAFDMI